MTINIARPYLENEDPGKDLLKEKDLEASVEEVKKALEVIAAISVGKSEHIKATIEKAINGAINRINKYTTTKGKTGGFVFVTDKKDKDGKKIEIETNTTVERKEGGKTEFANAIREKVATAVQSSIYYKLEKIIHEFQEEVELKAKLTKGKIFFKKDIIGIIDPSLPADSLLEKQAQEAGYSEEFNQNIEREIQA